VELYPAVLAHQDDPKFLATCIFDMNMLTGYVIDWRINGWRLPMLLKETLSGSNKLIF